MIHCGFFHYMFVYECVTMTKKYVSALLFSERVTNQENLSSLSVKSRFRSISWILVKLIYDIRGSQIKLYLRADAKIGSCSNWTEIVISLFLVNFTEIRMLIIPNNLIFNFELFIFTQFCFNVRIYELCITCLNLALKLMVFKGTLIIFLCLIICRFKWANWNCY